MNKTTWTRPLKFAVPLILATLLVLLIAAVVYASTPRLPHGLQMDGWRVDDMTPGQFRQWLLAHMETMGNLPLAIDSDPAVTGASRTTLTFFEIGWFAEPEPVWQQLRPLTTGSLWQKFIAKWQLRNKQLSLTMGVRAETMKQSVLQKWAALQAKQPIDAVRIITADDRIIYQNGVSVLRINEEQLANLVNQTARIRWGEVVGGKTENKLPLTTFQLPLYKLEPQVTIASLKAEGVERKIAQFSTAFSASGSGRVHNIRITAETMDEWVLAPGEIFDYGQIIAKTRATARYEPAPVLLNGRIVPGIGGGICQVSSTLYNAVLRAGLDIVERHNHSLPITYVPLGQDATFATGYLNFRFRNNSDAHLVIKVEVGKNGITVKLFGNIPDNVRYGIDSNIVKTVPPPVKIVHHPKLAAGSQQIIQKGKAGYIVETTRTKFVDGKAVQQTLVSRDTYAPKPHIIAKNTGPAQRRPNTTTPKKQILEDGVDGPVFSNNLFTE